MFRIATVLVAAAGVCIASPVVAQTSLNPLTPEIDRLVAEITPQVVAWREDIHEHPELGNREFRTSKLVADYLKGLGLDVRTQVAHTGVVAVLRGGRPGPVVALRADMDALPVTETSDLPFASKVTTEYNGQTVGVMHACGHDNHVAILLGTATVLASMRDRLPGTVVFLFQPAEEGAPEGEEGGAGLMIEEGALSDPVPDVVFGLHVTADPVGTIHYRPEGAMAGAAGLYIKIVGQQTHGAMPWRGIDPVVVASQVVVGLQSIIARQVDITRAPAIVTVATIHGGVRGNIIPDSVVMTGTVRTFDEEMRASINERITLTAEKIAESAGAEAVVRISTGGAVTWNDPTLTKWAVPTLEHAAGADATSEGPVWTASEDFALYEKKVPGLFFFLGVVPEGGTAWPNHSPNFFADERALPIGVKAMAGLAANYLHDHAAGVSDTDAAGGA